MDDRLAALAALDAHPEHERALPFLREWATSDDPIRVRHVIGRVRLPPPGEMPVPAVPVAITDELLAAVAACPHGGPSRGALPVSMQRECGCGGDLYPCALGRGKVAGRVATADCVRCKVAELDAVDAARLDENPPRADS